MTKELLSLLEKNQDMFSKKEQKLLEKAQKDYEKGLDFENKNNRGQSIHFYQKSWSNAQVLKDRAKQLLDSDGDGAMDQIEEKLGTDKNAIDTDQDGLLDGYEILKLYTSPLTKDTDKNGTQDSEEDLDQDRLSNLEEQKQGTDPVLKDSDADGLDDHLELKEFGTSPLLKDSDHDGLDDAGEYRVGTDPQQPDSDRDRLYDGLESYPQTFTDKKSGAVLEVTGEGDLSSAVSMQNVSEYTLFQDIPGAVSDFVDVSVEQKVEHATIKFPINKDAIPNGDLEKVKLVVYDKEKHQFTQLENQKIYPYCCSTESN
ncbi:hypothetical protein [uncultured Metabacillus sp.]|uniref:hypothetical protein n=1 Tax=uncultured Metabacillus sp. TaxID=2860135 RepID=UPI00261068A0|nr:hypothetical protein [uncultured Metabacillus sp.]